MRFARVKKVLQITCVSVVLFFFNNCSDGFKAENSTIESQSSSSNGENPPGPAITPAPTPPIGPTPTPTVIPGQNIEATTKVVSPAAQASAVFTFGQAFRKGDIPTGSYVGANIANFQADVKNRWSDGSVKFAVISGAVATTANQAVTIQFTKTATAPAGAAPSLATLKTILTNGQIIFSNGVTATIDLSTVINSAPFRAAYNSGSQMTEWHWRVPVGTDPFLETWLFIRLYSGGQIEIETCIENGHLKIVNPVTKNYTVTVKYNNLQRYSATLSHPYQSRWSRVDWYGTDPQITPAHSGAYMMSTLMVPNYAFTAIAAADLDSLTQTYQPLSLPNLPKAMGNTGAQTYIGLLMQADAMYLTSNGDARAYNAVMASARGLGTYQTHFRDETTNLPLAFLSYPRLCVNQDANNIGANPPSSTGEYTPRGAGAVSPGTWDFPHQPAPGYLAYLISGRRIFIDELQFVTTANYLSIGDNSRQGSQSIFDSRSAGTVRGAAWNLRTLAMTAVATPDGEPLRAQFQTAWGTNMAFYSGMYVAGTLGGGVYVNKLGAVMMYQTNGSNTSEYNSASGHLWSAAWMQAFLGATIGYAWDLEVTTDTLSRSNHQQFRDFVYKHAVGLAGDDTGFNYRRGAPYAMVYTQTENGTTPTWYTSWSQAQLAYESYYGLAHITGVGTLKQHSSDVDLNGSDSSSYPEGFFANMLPALSYATEHGAPGALAGLTRIKASPSWMFTSSFNHNPIWGILPR